MSRYFIEVSYKGTAYAGFQVQANAITVQEEVERRWRYFSRKDSAYRILQNGYGCTCDQNYFHFDLRRR